MTIEQENLLKSFSGCVVGNFQLVHHDEKLVASELEAQGLLIRDTTLGLLFALTLLGNDKMGEETKMDITQ